MCETESLTCRPKNYGLSAEKNVVDKQQFKNLEEERNARNIKN